MITDFTLGFVQTTTQRGAAVLPGQLLVAGCWICDSSLFSNAKVNVILVAEYSLHKGREVLVNNMKVQGIVFALYKAGI